MAWNCRFIPQHSGSSERADVISVSRPSERHSRLAATATTAAHPRAGSSLAALLAGHILQDGEIVLLILKPSLWFMLLSTLRFAAVVLIMMIAAKILDPELPGQNIVYQELGIFMLAGRLMFAVLQWMGRLYILTDMRIARLSGVFRVDIFSCPLRRVARTRIVRSSRERLTRLGTIEIIPSDETLPFATWSMIARPVEVHEQIVAAINKACHGP